MADSTSSCTIVAPSEFDYFRKKVYQTAVASEYDEAVVASNLSAHGQTLDFEISGDTNVYRDLSNSSLALRCRVVKSANDGSIGNIVADDAVAPVNLLLHSMFTDCEITVCGTRITEKENRYAYRAMIESLLSYSTDTLKSRVKLAGWQIDSNADLMDSLLLTDGNNAKANPDFVERRKLVTESRAFTLIGRPHADLFHQNLDIPPNCKVRVTLTRADAKFALLAAKDSTYRIAIDSAILYVRSKKLDEELLLTHRSLLDRADFHIPLSQVRMKGFQVATGLKSAVFTNIFPDKLPKRIVIGMVSQTRVSGTFELNPFKFENFTLSALTVRVGGVSVPMQPLTMDYKKGDYARAYVNTLAALNLDIGNQAWSITPDQWASSFNLYAFKLQPGAIDTGIEGVTNYANVDIELMFDTAPAAPIEVLVYSETARSLEINRYNTASLV